MLTTTDPYPMPATDCPRWCLEDHSVSWQQHVEAALHPRPIPAADGGFVTGPGTPTDEWLRSWTPYHRIPVGTVELTEGERVDVDLVRVGTEHTQLYIEGEGMLSAELARKLAAALLDAADELDKATR